MRKNENKSVCVLGISPSSRGFGYAVMATGNVLVDWGVKSVKSGRKNERCVAHVVDLIEIYRPASIALPDCLKNSRRGERVRAFIEEIADRADGWGIGFNSFSRKQVNLEILRSEDGTKHAIAQTLSTTFNEQLSFRLPKKRRPWTSESYQTDIFDAVALAKCGLGVVSLAA